MLFKLLKYDFRAMWKHFSLVWGAALVLALVNRMTGSLGFRFRTMDFEGRIYAVTFAILMAVFVAMFVIAVIFIVQRFYKGLLGDEGYLMHTLPVHPWQLVLSKLICAVVTYVVSGVVVILAIFVMIPLDWKELLNLPFWSDILEGLMKHPDIISLILEFCLVMLSAVLQSIAILYLAMSIGHLFSRHRVLASVVSFIGLYVLVNNVYDRVFSWDPIQLLVDAIDRNVHASMLAASATMLIPAAVFLAAVCWILDHKLNLE